MNEASTGVLARVRNKREILKHFAFVVVSYDEKKKRKLSMRVLACSTTLRLSPLKEQHLDSFVMVGWFRELTLQDVGWYLTTFLLETPFYPFNNQYVVTCEESSKMNRKLSINTRYFYLSSETGYRHGTTQNTYLRCSTGSFIASKPATKSILKRVGQRISTTYVSITA